MTKRVLKVEGMMCSNCTAKVEAALNALPGVMSAVADYRKGTATVEFDDEILDEDLTMAVIDAGFRARIKRGLFK